MCDVSPKLCPKKLLSGSSHLRAPRSTRGGPDALPELLDQCAEGPHLQVPVWRVLKCQRHTRHPAWLQLAVIVIENLSVSWWRGRTGCLTPLPDLTKVRVSSPD